MNALFIHFHFHCYSVLLQWSDNHFDPVSGYLTHLSSFSISLSPFLWHIFSTICPVLSTCQLAMPRDFTSVVTPFWENLLYKLGSVAMETALSSSFVYICMTGSLSLGQVPFCHALEGWLARLSHSALCMLLSEYICCCSGDKGTPTEFPD